MRVCLKDLTTNAISLQTDEKTYTYYRRETEIDHLFLFPWLSTQLEYPKMYFESKEGDQIIATAGKILSFEKAPIIISQVDPYLMAALSFSDSSEGFFVPRVEIIQRGKTFTFAYNSLDLFPDVVDLPQRILKKPSFQCSKLENSPKFDEWKKNIELALNSSILEKIVLARKTTFSIDIPPDPFSLLSLLKEKASHCFYFGVQWKKDFSFIGVSPERLFQRKKDLVITDVIAGTRSRGNGEEEDRKNGDELLNSLKDRHEFNIVKDAVVKSLAPHCSQLEISPLSLYRTVRVLHLHHQISGRLVKPDDQLLIDSLHPSPAVGGWPKEPALHFLKEYEPFSRDSYAAPIGFLSPHYTDLAVGIRSCVIKQNQVHLYAGTGIVDGSTPEKEWEELEEKVHFFKNEIFHVSE